MMPTSFKPGDEDKRWTPGGVAPYDRLVGLWLTNHPSAASRPRCRCQCPVQMRIPTRHPRVIEARIVAVILSDMWDDIAGRQPRGCLGGWSGRNDQQGRPAEDQCGSDQFKLPTYHGWHPERACAVLTQAPFWSPSRSKQELWGTLLVAQPTAT